MYSDNYQSSHFGTFSPVGDNSYNLMIKIPAINNSLFSVSNSRQVTYICVSSHSVWNMNKRYYHTYFKSEKTEAQQGPKSNFKIIFPLAS